MKKYVVEYVIKAKEGKLETKKQIFYNRVDYIDFIDELKKGVHDNCILIRNYMTHK